MAQRSQSSSVEVRNKAEANANVVGVDEGPSNLFVHFEDSVVGQGGISRVAATDIHQFIGMAVATADLSLRRVEDHDDGWLVVLKKE